MSAWFSDSELSTCFVSRFTIKQTIESVSGYHLCHQDLTLQEVQIVLQRWAKCESHAFC